METDYVSPDMILAAALDNPDRVCLPTGDTDARVTRTLARLMRLICADDEQISSVPALLGALIANSWGGFCALCELRGSDRPSDILNMSCAFMLDTTESEEELYMSAAALFTEAWAWLEDRPRYGVASDQEMLDVIHRFLTMGLVIVMVDISNGRYELASLTEAALQSSD